NRFPNSARHVGFVGRIVEIVTRHLRAQFMFDHQFPPCLTFTTSILHSFGYQFQFVTRFEDGRPMIAGVLIPAISNSRWMPSAGHPLPVLSIEISSQGVGCA